MANYISKIFTPGFRLIDGSALNNTFDQSSSTSLVAAGTTIADALQLTSKINVLATVAANTGVKLRSNLNIGEYQDVYNDGANAVQVYSAQGTIDGTAGATGVALTNAKRCRYTLVAPGVLKSEQLGAVSA
jgi:hypothetical protein